jgi:carbon dioxide concentrating mechanism protein CcmM
MTASRFTTALAMALLLLSIPLAGCDDEEAASPEASAQTGAPGEATPLASDQVLVNGSSYVSPLVAAFGDVYVGADSYVGPNTVLRAAPELRVELGNESNAQDNVLIRARERSASVGDRTSLAHHAKIRDAEIGNFVFLGIGAEVVDSNVEDGVFVGHGAYVEGVEIPEGAFVRVGERVTTQPEADALPQADAFSEEYRNNLLEVSAELADGYIEVFESSDGYDRLIDVGPNPKTSYNTEAVEPELGNNVILEEFARLVGDVRVGAGSRIGQGSTLRADEGTPIVVGVNADIDDRVSFHALRGTDLRTGDELTAEDDAVLHGPLEVGDNVTVEDRAIVFRAVVGDNVQIGEDVVIVGPAEKDSGELPLRIPDGTIIPEGSIITSPEDLQN